MIEFSKIEENDYDSLLAFLNNNNIYINEIMKSIANVFIIKENKKLYGIGMISYEGQDIFIENFYIAYNQRYKGFGEGLLRSILHYGRINKKKNIYYSKNNIDVYNFLLHMGFVKYKEVLYTDIEDFFSQPCNSSGYTS